MNFRGAWTALVTPMTADGGIDWAGLEKNIQFQIDQGITGLVPTGTTGESPTLTWEEHNRIVEKTAELARGRCRTIAGTGSNSTAEAVESSEHAVEHGADAVLLVDCYYNGPSSLELRHEYYGVVAELLPDTPIVPYIIPGRSGTALSVEDMAILAADFPNIHSVKEASGDLERMARTRKLLGPEFQILSGDDDLTYTMMTSPDIAAQGVISVVSNIVPGPLNHMAAAVRSGNAEGAEKLRDALSPLFAIVTVKADSTRALPNGETVTVQDRFRNPLAIKIAMQGLGMPAGPARQPLGRITLEGIAIVRGALRTVWQNHPEILQPTAEFYGIDIEARLSSDSVWASLAYG